MAKFKVGDRVKANANFQCAAKAGDVATVAKRGEYWCSICRTTFVDLTWDRVIPYHGQNDGGYYLKDFDVVANDNDNTSPVRTITRREIVPGKYERVEVSEWGKGSRVTFDVVYPTAASLRSAARIFNEIADVLDEQSAETKDAA